MDLKIISTKDELREQLADWKSHEEHIALVPTMGNLHQGHLKLIELAREHAERVVVTIFVNPTQFGADEDFAAYPRTPDRDARRLKRAGADLLFTPDVETVYPFGTEAATTVSVPVIGEEFCGSSRPGHFDGVTSIVSRLIGLVQPDVAVFGQKDYQQQLVIRRLVDDLNMPLKIVTSETIREDDGLAMSSRNQYLTDEQREIAPVLYATLNKIGEDVQSGMRNYDELEARGLQELSDAGLSAEYVGIRRAENLQIPDRDCDEIVVLGAAMLGETRLIDNVVVSV